MLIPAKSSQRVARGTAIQMEKIEIDAGALWDFCECGVEGVGGEHLNALSTIQNNILWSTYPC